MLYRKCIFVCRRRNIAGDARTFVEGLRRSIVAHFARKVRGTNIGAARHELLSRCSELVYIELSYYFVPTAVLKKERSGLRD